MQPLLFKIYTKAPVWVTINNNYYYSSELIKKLIHFYTASLAKKLYTQKYFI